ncbi:MAG: RDD family protein, partial [Actinomycetota bacterium]|nr:RDD family protein [Actinomycetota bacterium]
MAASQQFARVLEVETPESVAFRYELAGLGSRGIAAMMDLTAITLLIIGEVLLTLLVTLIVGAIIGESIYLFTAWALGGLIAAVFITYWGYFIFGDIVRNGQTWGKRRLGIRVVREDGSRVTVIDSIIRNLVRVIDLMPGNYAVGIVSVLVSREARRIGDLAAGTVVIRMVDGLTEFSPAGADPETTEL